VPEAIPSGNAQKAAFMPPLDPQQLQRISDAVDARRKELDESEMDLAIEAAGIHQAVEALRGALKKVEECLDQREY